MGGMPMQFVKSTAVYVSCVAGAVSFNESAATPHMTKGSPALLLLTHDTIMRSCKPGLIDRWPCAQNYRVQGGVSRVKRTCRGVAPSGCTSLLSATTSSPRKYRNTKGWRPLSRRKRSPPLLLGHEGDAVTGHHCAAR